MTAEKGAGSIRSVSDLNYERTIADLRDRIADLEMHLSEARMNIAMLRIVARQLDDAGNTAANALSDQMPECGCRMCSARRSTGVA